MDNEGIMVSFLAERRGFFPFSNLPGRLWGLSIQWIPWAFFCMGKVAKA
jgi:hypothetical protein